MSRNPKRKRPSSPPNPPPQILKASPEPYPEHLSPSPEQCRAVRDALLSLHGFPAEFSPYRRLSADAESPADRGVGVLGETVLDGLVCILLSQNTTDLNSRRAFQSLKSSFPTWDQVLDAESKLVEDAIRCGGLAATKTARIKGILGSLREKRGVLCLEYLRALSIDKVKDELSKFKGIGPKTIACVLMFHLKQEDFPVDTHVFRITKDIGWVPMKADRQKAYLHLNKRIPDDLKFDLNCLLITHGKLCQKCTKRGGAQLISGSDSSCPLHKPID